MANTYTQLFVQIIFAVKGRQNLISREWKDELYKYITGIVSNKNQKMICINGVQDHVHILIGLKADKSISDLVRDIKSNSSDFINKKGFIKGKFNWQKGFGAFSYSNSQMDRVVRYIMNQENHHHKKTFKEEYIEFLKKKESAAKIASYFTFTTTKVISSSCFASALQLSASLHNLLIISSGENPATVPKISFAFG